MNSQQEFFIITYEPLKSEFAFRYFDIVHLAAVKYYGLLMDDVDEVCSNPSEDVQDDEVDLQSLSLAFRLSVLDQDWAKYISVRCVCLCVCTQSATWQKTNE